MILSILSLLLFNLSINKDSGIYEKGERAVVSCHTDIVPTDSLFVSVSYNNKVGQEFRILPTSTDFTVLEEQALDSTCAVSIEVKERSGASASIGYVVAPEGFRAGYEEPADLMDYWDNLKQQLKALPMQVKTTPLAVPQQYQNKFTCEDVEINCLGPAPMRAYVAKPVGAKEKSLPIIILCRAAGVKGDWCRCSVNECVGNAALGNDALSLDLNAHGMLNGQSDDYYQMLEDGPLKNYFEYNAADRETYYFRGMYLRVLRAIEYMTSLPEWDGRRILPVWIRVSQRWCLMYLPCKTWAVRVKDGSADGHSLLKTTRTSLRYNSITRCPISMAPNSSDTHRPRYIVRSVLSIPPVRLQPSSRR